MERLGDKLRNRREELALTIKDIETKTNIRAKYLEAIEVGDYEALPGEVFLKGFIKNYSESLGFDSTEILKQYHAEKNNVRWTPKELVATTDGDNNVRVKSKELEELINTLNSSMYVREPEQQIKSNVKIDLPERKSSSSVKNVLIIFLIICAGSLAGYIFFAESGVFVDDSKKKVADVPEVTTAVPSTPTVSTTKETKVMETKPVETPKVPEIPVAPTKPTEPAKVETKPTEPVAANKTETKVDEAKKSTSSNSKQAVKVVANVTETCWMNVIVDGKAVFTGTASPGENKNWVANEQVTVHLGNAGGVNLTVNDQKIDKGKQGEVVTRTFNATK